MDKNQNLILDKAYKAWVHPHLRSNPKSEQLSRQYFANLIPGTIGYFLIYLICDHLDYYYGEIACLVGLGAAVVSILLLRFSKYDGISHFGLLSMAVALSIASLGAGGVGSIFSIPLIWMVWIAFLYGIRSGLIWSGIMVGYCIVMLVLGLLDIRFYNTIPESDFYIFSIVVVLIAIVITALFFWASKLNENRLFKKLEESKSELIKNEKMASLGLLASGMAHEINNPLNFINGNNQALMLDVQDLSDKFLRFRQSNEFQKNGDFTEIEDVLGEMEYLLKGIDKGSQRITRLVKGMDFFLLPPEPFSEQLVLLNLLNASVKNIMQSRSNKEIAIKVDIDETIRIRGQKNRLIVAFEKIVQNAIEASKTGSQIIAGYERGDNNHVISIKDNGVGMDKTALERIFDPFFTKKEIGEGTGLGMYVAYRVIKDNNGEINVESEVGEGTKVSISLPV